LKVLRPALVSQCAARSPNSNCDVKETSTTIAFEVPLPILKCRSLERFIGAARKAARLQGHVSVLITSNSRIRDLNLRFRGKNSTTDVLSFPSGGTNGFAGDIAISMDMAARSAEALGHSLDEEIRLLILHGVLHLAGYDHENDRGQMRRKENALRRTLALPSGLIERSSTTTTSSTVRRRPSTKLRSSDSGQRPTTPYRQRLRT
jgi:probable rRNA maturation factor